MVNFVKNNKFYKIISVLDISRIIYEIRSTYYLSIYIYNPSPRIQIIIKINKEIRMI